MGNDGFGSLSNVTVNQFADGQAKILQSYFASDPNFTGGFYVSAGEVAGDGHADVIVCRGVTRPTLGAALAMLLCDATHKAAFDFRPPKVTWPTWSTATPLSLWVAGNEDGCEGSATHRAHTSTTQAEFNQSQLSSRSAP